MKRALAESKSLRKMEDKVERFFSSAARAWRWGIWKIEDARYFKAVELVLWRRS